MKPRTNGPKIGLIAMLVFSLLCSGMFSTVIAIGEEAQTPTLTEESQVQETSQMQEPTHEDTPEPTQAPTAEPTSVPTAVPTQEPTVEPTSMPTQEPTVEPTSVPTQEPTVEPTSVPTAVPTPAPTVEPENDSSTDQSNTNVKLILTINYADDQSHLLPISETLPENPVKVALLAGDTYTVALPEVEGYTCTVPNKVVSIGMTDEEITIVYTAVTTTQTPTPDNDTANEVMMDDHLDELPEPTGRYVLIRCDTGSEAELGDKIILTAELHGFGGLKVSYQWQRYNGKDWVDIQDETSNKYVMSQLDKTDFGDIRVVVDVLL